MLALIEMSMIFVGTYLQKSSSQNLQEAYKNQLKYRNLATELKNCSDYLTDECRSFAVTGDMDYFRSYWNEAKNEMHIEISSMRLTLESQETTAAPYADQYAEDTQLQEWISEALAYPLEERIFCLRI